MTAVKIAVIGAGSAQFSAGLINDLCRTPTLAGSTVCLMDINETRLPIMQQLGRRFADELSIDYRFEATTDREVALQDADFCINTAFVQGHHHGRAMRELTAQHGYYYGGVGLGPWYQLRLMLDVARHIERLCPDAWLIQSGNPVFQGSTLMTRETDVKVCGLCHGHYGVHQVARALGLDPDKVTWQAPGLNHNIWLTHFDYEGQDAYTLLDQWIEEQGEDYWTTHVATGTHDIDMSRGAVHQYKLYGLYPIGNTPRSGGWWYHTDIQTKKHWFGEPYGGPDTELARPKFVENLEDAVAGIARALQDPQTRFVELAAQMLGGRTMTGEQIVPIMDALTNGDATPASKVEYQVNVPNRGALEGLPDDVVVEVPAIVNRKGIQPLHVTPLPNKLMLEQILPDWLDMERQLEAFHSGDRSMLLWQVLESHQTRSYDQAVAVLEDLLAMEGNAEMNAAFAYPEGW